MRDVEQRPAHRSSLSPPGRRARLSRSPRSPISIRISLVSFPPDRASAARRDIPVRVIAVKRGPWPVEPLASANAAHLGCSSSIQARRWAGLPRA
jgi:hypothetical protein